MSARVIASSKVMYDHGKDSGVVLRYTKGSVGQHIIKLHMIMIALLIRCGKDR